MSIDDAAAARATLRALAKEARKRASSSRYDVARHLRDVAARHYDEAVAATVRGEHADRRADRYEVDPGDT